MKKIIIISITIVILVLLILFGIFFLRNKELSKIEFISLMEKFENVSNVKLEGTSTTYIKDNCMLVIDTSDIYSWSNTETNEFIRYSPNRKEYIISEITDVEDSTGLRNFPYTFIRL